jgi:Xaa-Pro aminopeptidase
MNQEQSRSRREKLHAAMQDGDAVILFAALEEKLKKFKQDNDFLYITGLEAPNSIYLAFKSTKVAEFLFIQRGIPEREVWEGKKMTVEEAVEQSGISNVLYLDQFEAALSQYCPSILRIHANIGFQELDMPLSYPMFKMQPLRERYPQIQILCITGIITPLRKIKSDWEIQQLQRAIDITGKGILDILESATVGMMEYELEAMLFYRMQRSGLKHWGFAPIIAAGINAATLHYEKNECQIAAGDLILMDVGADNNNYSADITRCFPISGKFSERQAQVYNAVLRVQKAIIEMIKPGVELMDLQNKTRELIAQELIQMGLISEAKDVVTYYMHGVSHFLGMNTHDVGGRSAALEVGNVITVEPGIYIPEEKLGVRIEDDVLVTEAGHCVLSQNIPKEISEIEEILSGRP